MGRYIGPILGVLLGLMASHGLQWSGVSPSLAKLIGVAVAIVGFLAYGRVAARQGAVR